MTFRLEDGKVANLFYPVLIKIILQEAKLGVARTHSGKDARRRGISRFGPTKHGLLFRQQHHTHTMKNVPPPAQYINLIKFFGQKRNNLQYTCTSTSDLAVGLHYMCVTGGRPNWLIFAPRLLGIEEGRAASKSPH